MIAKIIFQVFQCWLGGPARRPTSRNTSKASRRSHPSASYRIGTTTTVTPNPTRQGVFVIQLRRVVPLIAARSHLDELGVEVTAPVTPGPSRRIRFRGRARRRRRAGGYVGRPVLNRACRRAPRGRPVRRRSGQSGRIRRRRGAIARPASDDGGRP